MVKKLILLLYISVVISCSIPENLGLPSWSSKFQLYVLNDTYEAIDLAKEDSTLIALGDTLGFLQTMNETSELDFTTDMMEDSDVFEIGDLVIDDPVPTNTSIPLSEVAPSLQNGFIAAPGILPFTMPDVLKDDLAPFDEFQEILYISGQMQFSLTNNTVIWFGNIAIGEPFIISILDVNDNVILTHEFAQDIPPDNSITIVESHDLAGITMFNEIKVLSSGGSRGSDGEAVDVNIDATLDIEVAVLNPVAQWAIAQIPAQTENDTLYVTLDEDVTIYLAHLNYHDNNITIDIENEIDLEMEATVRIEALRLAGSATSYTKVINIPASGGFGQVSYATEFINVNGATLGDGETPLDSLQVLVDVLTLDSGDEYREISSADVFNIFTTIDSLEFDYVKGILQPQEQDEIHGDSVVEIEYPHIEGDFAIVGYSEVRFEIQTPIPSQMTVELNAINSSGETIQMVDYANNAFPVLDIASGGSSIILTSDEYNINEFISILPDSIWYTIYPLSGDPEEIFEYSAGDNIESDITIESILDIEADCWVIPKDEYGNPQMDKIDTKDIGQTEINAFLDAKLTLSYNNNLGFETSAKILFAQQKTEDFGALVNPDTTQFTIITVPFIAQSTGPEFDQIEVEITQNDLQFFLADSVFVVPKIQLISDEGFPLSGSISLQGLMELEIEISSGLVE